jgi:hypothetical protein
MAGRSGYQILRGLNCALFSQARRLRLDRRAPQFAPTGRAAWARAGSPVRSGLGIASDPMGDHEIWGSTFIVIDFSGPFAAGYRTYQFEMGSTTYGEGWDVYGTNDTPGPSATLRPVYIDGTDELVKHTLSGYRYYLFSYNGGVVDPRSGRQCAALQDLYRRSRALDMGDADARLRRPRLLGFQETSDGHRLIQINDHGQ